MSDMNKLVEQGWSNRVADQPLEKPQIDSSFIQIPHIKLSAITQGQGAQLSIIRRS
jgi:hypothetical protein